MSITIEIRLKDESVQNMFAAKTLLFTPHSLAKHGLVDKKDEK